MILVIDNYDSFTYNLVQYIGSMGHDLHVVRNDAITTCDIDTLGPDKILISPGPGYPDEAGISLQTITTFAGKIPIMGVCLGMQAIGQAFGGKIIPAKELVHGKYTDIKHDHKTIFTDIPNPFQGGRYHSLVIANESMPDCLETSAQTQDGEIMAVRHKEFLVEGVQFHPESILTKNGYKILENFMTL
ncbi:anthranilate/aminodeoxychorismate synthase component II [candidate division KSB1 bacterium]|nr:anthranilate/aminodeoxychorismate synthase component II [candidate division KSB1 bacterium]